VNAVDWGAELRRYAIPVLILLLATVGALVARSALAEDRAPAAKAKPAPKERHIGAKRAAAKFHLVESGDTLGDIAERYGTTVARLRGLNPRVDPAALRVGQQIRLPIDDG
jgi:nucleoid-associated protein YgaU